MEHKIYYHDTDAGGIVYYANYLKYLEEARTEYLEARGLGVVECTQRGFFFAVRSCNVIYKSPARYGDVIISDAFIERRTPVQFFFKQTVRDKASGKILVEAVVALVCLTHGFKPVALPDDLKERLS